MVLVIYILRHTLVFSLLRNDPFYHLPVFYGLLGGGRPARGSTDSETT